VRTAILRQLRLLIACLLLAVAARPAAGALETPRAVAVLVASAGVRSQDAAPQRVAVARPGSRARAPAAAFVSPPPASLERTAAPADALDEAPFRGTAPLYLTNERFLL
jgi:hypothetical protein